MIENLKGQTKFATTGETILVDFQPQKGITAVVGPNGSGKTFTAIEAVRFLLFGTSALRGILADYAELEMVGTVQIRGHRYRVERSKTSQKIFNADGVQVAIGSDAVNKLILHLLGYNLDVFDVCNASVQGQTASFGKMRPAERKALIDQVMGLVDVKTAEKACREESATLRREAEAMAKLLRTPGPEPIKPKDYESSISLRAKLGQLRALRDAQTALRSQLQSAQAPARPEVINFSEDEIFRLQRIDRLRLASEDKRDRLAAIVAKRPFRSIAEIDLAVKQYEWELEVGRHGQKPKMTREDVDQMIKALEGLDDREVECPNCAYVFRTREPAPATPEKSLRELQLEDSALRSWDGYTPPPEPGSHDSYPESMALEYRMAHKAADAAQEELNALLAVEDVSEKLEAQLDAQRQMSAYFQAQLNYERVREANRAVEAQLVASDAQLDEVSEAFHAADLYETQCFDHQASIDCFKHDTSAIADVKKRSDEFKEGAEGLADARATLKTYLAPTLSRVASKLIFDMTNGKLSTVVIDEEMNVTVDKQRLETLSGAGSTVASIAIRIALGQVLVGKAFPVFIGDEMDGDLDVQRREATIQAMVALKDHLSQIILITHRDVGVADYVLDLGEKK